jgi:hypothetical protein
MRSEILGLALASVLLVSTGCGSESSGQEDGGPAPLPEDTYERVLSQGVDPALVYTIELDGFELAEQSAGVLGDSDYGAVYVPTEPPLTAQLRLTVVAGEPDEEGYRSGEGWHEYVVSFNGHHLTVGAPSDAVDREALAEAALGARRQDGTTVSPAPPTSPVPRGDLPTNGDGAPVDPAGTSPPGG